MKNKKSFLHKILWTFQSGQEVGKCWHFIDAFVTFKIRLKSLLGTFLLLAKSPTHVARCHKFSIVLGECGRKLGAFCGKIGVPISRRYFLSRKRTSLILSKIKVRAVREKNDSFFVREKLLEINQPPNIPFLERRFD